MKSILTLFCLSVLSAHAETQITWKRQQLHGDFYSEGAAIGDINGDGKADVVAGPFWWEGPAFEKKHAYYEPKIFSIHGYSDNFFAYIHDFNADKKNDVLILGFPGKEARLYLNPGSEEDTPWPMHIVADVVDNESPVFTDITGDGKPEIVCSTGGRFGWFAPNWDKPTDKWTFVPVSDDMKVAKFTHGLGVGDVNRDGKMDLLEARRWWEAPAGIADLNSQISNASTWQQHNFAAGVGGGAQMFAYDFDGNGTNDVFTALAAHRYGVAVFLQNKPMPDKPTWQRVMLASEQPQDNDYGIVFSQPHAAHLADINGDGVKDIVTGKRYWAHNGHDPDEYGHRVIYWYQTKRDGKGGVDFIPHLVDAESGVGVDVQVGDVNGDLLPDIVVGNKAGVFILTQERKASVADLTPKKLYGPALKPQAEYAKGTSVSVERLRPAGSLTRPAEDRPKSNDTGVDVRPGTASGGTPDAARGTRALQHPLDLMQLPTGFKAELIAAEPDLVQPIAFTFDERGRIWVVEGNSYPKPREVGAGQDRIKILEDKDGDGSFETIKIFCEGLNLVSGIELGFGGVWIGAAPYLMFIPDKDRDDRPDAADPADKRPLVPGLKFAAYALLDGWGSQDTHETLNSFIWGPDGWLYGCHGVFTHSRVGKPGSPDDQRQPINAGVWRYHPVRHEFEIFAHGTSNPWGLDYDQHGEFFVTSCVIPHLFHIVPGGRYQRQAGQHFNPHTYEDIKTIADHAHYAGALRPNINFDKTTGAGLANEDTNALGGGHAHCGLAIYQSSLFPPTYRNQLIFGNLHGHRLVANYTDPKGSSFIGKHAADFMRANDMHFIPVTQKVGPDGALYVSDWSDQQICHRGSNAVENWDRSNGRIYRVTYPERLRPAGSLTRPAEDRPKSNAVGEEAPPGTASGGTPDAARGTRALLFPTAPFDLAKESDEALAKLAVQTENEWFSRMARRVLMERNWADVLDYSIVEEHADLFSLDDKVSIQSFWLLHQTGSPLGCLVRQEAKVDIGGINPLALSWLIRIRHQSGNYEPVDDDTWPMSNDDFRLKAAKLIKSPIVRRELASALQRLPISERKDLATALLKYAEDKDDPMIPLLIWYGIEPLIAADPAVGLQLAKASKIEKVTGFIYRRLTSDDAGRTSLIKLAAETDDAALRTQLMEAILGAARAGNKITQPADWPKMRVRLVGEKTSAQLTELEALMGIETALKHYRDRLSASSTGLNEREAALLILLRAKDDATAKILLQIITIENPPSLRRKAIQALASLKDAETPKILSAALPKLSKNELPDAINTLASTKEGAKALLKAVEARTVPSTSLSPFLIRQLSAFDDTEIHALIKSAWGDVNAPKADMAQQVKKYQNLLTPTALAKGNATTGKSIFMATCGACHKLFGEGQRVGPDITGSNRADLNYLLENVLDPNAVIGKDYQLNIFNMKDGRVMSGVIKEESPASVKIAMMGGVEFTLPVADIAKREISKMSTMPEGLFDALPPEMVVDLVKYLQSGAAAPTKTSSARSQTNAPTLPGTLEAESLKIMGTTGGKTRRQGMSGFGNQWSSGAQLWWTGGKPGDKLTLSLPIQSAGKYTLHSALTMAHDYGMVSITLDGKPITSTFDGYNADKVILTDEQDWGTHELTAGDHALTFTLQTPNPAASSGNMMGIDYVRLVRR
jgi:putative membrane-bound dehydrogenase-like protein